MRIHKFSKLEKQLEYARQHHHNSWRCRKAYEDPSESTGIHRDPPGSTRIHQDPPPPGSPPGPPGSTGIHQIHQDPPGFHQEPGSTRIPPGSMDPVRQITVQVFKRQLTEKNEITDNPHESSYSSLFCLFFYWLISEIIEGEKADNPSGSWSWLIPVDLVDPGGSRNPGGSRWILIPMDPHKLFCISMNYDDVVEILKINLKKIYGSS